jgi:hypothetical protein
MKAFAATWLGVACLFAAVAVSPAAALFNLDHYKCYKVKDLKNPKFSTATVSLTDQFGINDGSFEVKKPFLFCNPADKNGQGILNVDDHLTCYKVKGPKLLPADRPKVVVGNQLGTIQLEAKKAVMLCLPSAETALP